MGGESTIGCNAYERNRMENVRVWRYVFFDTIASIFQVEEKKKHTHTHPCHITGTGSPSPENPPSHTSNSKHLHPRYNALEYISILLLDVN